MIVRSLVGPELVPYMVMRTLPIDFAKINPWLSSLQSVTVQGTHIVPSVNKGKLHMAFILKYFDQQ
jgi:hypothetical protein